MCDCFVELARLVRNDAKHVLGLGIIGLRRGSVASEIVGVGEKSVAPFLLGENERLTGRHRWRRNQ
jgi:hypothetical protein